MKYITAMVSNVGGRSENQDYCGFREKSHLTCWVAADGLGGHRGGEVASSIATETILNEFEKEPEISAEALVRYIKAAQDAIIIKQEEDPKLFSMRTTVAILIADSKSAIWSHIGDTRLYHFRDGQIIFQTKDHSVPQAMFDAGDITYNQIRQHEDRNRLLRTLGHEGNLRPAVEKDVHIVQPQDSFLLCTDGFWEYVTEIEMEADLARSKIPNNWLDFMSSRVISRAEGKYDNYSAIAIFVQN
ncbi:MAG: serine/threonine-protein phosphatase [Desulfamplus sp.]|nr:serine/threonine-protein phosphatase [Desulfamplus sp.]